MVFKRFAVITSGLIVSPKRISHSFIRIPSSTARLNGYLEMISQSSKSHMLFFTPFPDCDNYILPCPSVILVYKPDFVVSIVSDDDVPFDNRSIPECIFYGFLI